MKFRIQRYPDGDDRRWFVEFWNVTGKKRKWISNKKYPSESDKEGYIESLIRDFKNNSLSIEISPPKGSKPIINLNSANEIALSMYKGEVRQTTENCYQSSLKKFIFFLNEPNRKLNSVTQSDALRFLSYLINEQQNSINSRNAYLLWLKAVFDRFFRFGYIKENPFVGIKLLVATPEGHKPYTDAQKKMVFEQIRDDDKQLLIVVLLIYQCFLRPNEIAQLKKKHIDFERCRINVSKNISKTKIAKYPRFNAKLKLELEQYFDGADAEDFLVARNKTFGKFPMRPQSLWLRHRKVLQKLNLTDSGLTLYSWKHTGNIELYKMTSDVKLIQRQNGHSTLLMTDRYLRDLGLLLDDEDQEIELPSF